MTVAETVVVMNGGTVEQVGTPKLFERPEPLFVEQFIGFDPDQFRFFDGHSTAAVRLRNPVAVE